MKRSNSWNKMANDITSKKIKRTNSAWKIQVEPNPKNYKEKDIPEELVSSVLKAKETALKSCENSDVLEIISNPTTHGDVFLDMNFNFGILSQPKASREVGASISKSPSNADDPPESFFKAMKPVVILAQCFGLFPVIGITGPNYRSLRFRWLQWRILHGLFGLGGLIFLFTYQFLETAGSNFSYPECHSLIFLSSQIAVACFCIKLARKWPKINKDFAEIELNLKKYGDLPESNLKIKIITFMLVALGGAQYVMGVYKNSLSIELCYELDGFGSTFKTFMINLESSVFSRIPYSHWSGALITYFHILTNFTWTFKDLLLASISISLSLRLKQLNGALFQIHAQEMPPSFWRTIREDYNEMSILVTKIDSDVQILMLISIVENLYLICINVLVKITTTNNHIYELAEVFLLLGLLILRTVLVLFPTATINDESKKAKKVLYSIPQNSYCSETKRFLMQLTTDEAALTGWGFFSVTRGLILTMVGAFITYEIILGQFSKNLNYEQGDLALPKLNKSNCATF